MNTFEILTCVLIVLVAIVTSKGIESNEQFSTKQPRNINFKIANGQFIEIEETPFLVSVYGSGTCGGNLITPTFLVTAAHCKSPIKQFTDYVVRMGTKKLTSGGEVIKVIGGAVHPKYKYKVLDKSYDVAVMELEKEVILSKTIALIQLVDVNFKLKENNLSYVAGWGQQTGTGTPSIHLKRTQLKIFSDTKCKKRYSLYNDKMVCAGPLTISGKDGTCRGDSGSPLYTKDQNSRFILNGIVSFGYDCGTNKSHSFFVNLANPEINRWIFENTDLQPKACLGSCNE